jgi:WXG100 family type VII secretion target
MQLEVTPERLLTAGIDCKVTNEMIQVQIARMQSYIATLMGSYTGVAAQAMHALCEQWGADAKKLNYVLTTISAGLTENGHNYVHHETVNTVNLHNVTASLPTGRF